MKTRRVKGNRFCALKLDMMKAYDRLEWPYLKAVMIKLGFSPRFTEIVMRCVSSVFFSIIFNGGKQEDFTPSRSLRQEGPISPYLFLLAAKGLSCLLKSMLPMERIQGITVEAGSPEVNHLVFEDDSLLFFNDTPEMAKWVDDLLQRYCSASGQRINKDKFFVFFSKGCAEYV